MKGKMKLKSVVAVMLALVLTFVGIDPMGWISGAMDEVQAEELTEITWSDFLLFDAPMKSGTTFPSYEGTISYKADTLNNTAFEGDVKIPSGQGFRYAVPTGHYGLTIQESSGQLLIGGDGYVKVNGSDSASLYPLNASDYGLTTFTDTRFTIRIELYNLSDNLSATLNIYVNGKIVGEGITLQGTKTEYSSTYLGKCIGFNINGLSSKNITVYDKTTEITWSDFLLFDTPMKSGTTFPSYEGTISYKADTLNNTAFEGDVKIPSGQGFRYAVPTGHYGLTIQESSGQLLIGGDGYVKVNGSDSASLYPLNASDYGLTTFTDTRFTIRIELYNLSDNLSATLNIYVNGKIVGEGITLQGTETGYASTVLGKCIGFNINGLSSENITVYDKTTEITWSDFLLFDTPMQSVTALPSYGGSLSYSGETLNNTAFEGDVKIPSEQGFRYAVPTGHYGLAIKESSGQLLIGGDGYVKVNGSDTTVFPLQASDYGLTTFTDTRFTIRIELYNLSSDNLSATLNIYVNGKIVGEGITLQGTKTEYSSTYLGKCIGFNINGLSSKNITVYDKITEITWSDFNYGTTPVTSGTTIPSGEYTINYSKGTLNNTAFEGDVKIPEGNGFRYAVPTGHFGLSIKESSGQLLIGGDGYVKVNGSDTTVFPLQAGEYGLTTFTNTRFTMRIELYNLSSDNLSATLNIYVNGKIVGEGITLQGTKTEYPTTILGNGIGFNYSGLLGGVTVYDAQDGLKTITWETFGAISGKTYTAGGNPWDTSLAASGLTDLNNTIFKGDVIFADNTTIMYGGINYVSGLQFGVQNKNFVISSYNGFTVNPEVTIPSTNADNYGLTSFVDNKFTLEIEMTKLTTTQAVVSVVINNEAVASEMQLTSNNPNEAMWKLGNILHVTKGSITPLKNVAVPTDLAPLSWEEFGFTGGVTYKSSTNVDSTSRSALHLTNLDNTLFNGDVEMTAGSQLIYGGTNGWTGIRITANSDGTLEMTSVGSTETPSTTVFNPKHYGLTSFAGDKFNLKIAMTDGDFSDVNSYKEKVRVWINDQILGDPFTFISWKADILGNTLHMGTAEGEDSITPYSSRTTVPTDLETISFEDWMKEDALLDGNLNNFEINGANPNVGTLLGTTLSEVVKFVGEETTTRTHAFAYGGNKDKENGQDYGIYIKLNDKNMVVDCPDVGISFTLDPTIAGVGTSFANTEFSWRIDTKELGDSNNILLYISFNGVLYNNAPFVIYDFVDKISNTMVYNSIETQEPELAKTYYTVLGPSIKTLPVLYHDLAKGVYTIPQYQTVTFYEKNASGEWIEGTKPASLTTTGNYKLEFNDGVSNYIQEIACYYYETDVSAASLVRSLKMKQTDKTTYKEYGEGYETRLCDTNYDGKVDADDIDDIRSMLLETYEADTNVMRISGFFSPTASLIEDATYQNIKAIGVNHIIESDTAYSDDPLARYRTYQELAYAQKYGIKVTVRDARLIAKVVKSTHNAEDQKAAAPVDTDITKEEVEESVVNYKNYQSFDSLFLIDEPKSEDYPNIGVYRGMRQVELYTQLATAIKAARYDLWTNAFGGDHGLLDNGYNIEARTYMRNGYYKYLQQLVNDFGLDYISFTEYPFVRSDEDSVAALRKRYTTIDNNELKIIYETENSPFDEDEITDMDAVLLNLALAKSVSEKAVEGKTLEFRTFVAATASTENGINRNFNGAQMKWQANMNLAFGSDVLQYFTLVPAPELKNYDNGTCASGLLDEDGNISKFGTWATSVNKQVAAIDDILKGATHEGFMAVGTYAEDAESTVSSIEIQTGIWRYEELTNKPHDTYAGASVKSSDTTYGAFAGCFKISETEHAMYIVNFSDVNENTVTVSCGTSAITAIYQGKETEYTGSAEIKLAPGEAVLVVY